MGGVSRPQCIEPGCDREGVKRRLCQTHYWRHRTRGDLSEFPPLDGQCERCELQLKALAADGGRGDRPMLAGTMTLGEASAYMLGFFDRRASTDPEDGIDPYIVQRFHELRTQ